MENEEGLKEEIVPLKSRIWVSGADAAVAFIQIILVMGLTYYFVNARGLNPVLAGIVWLIFGVWNAVNDPIFGHISDKTKSKLGRRIPYIRYGAPIIATAYILCWIDYPNSDQLAMFLQLLIFLFFYDILYTAVASALYVMPYEMAVSNKARGSIFVWRLFFSVFATIVPLILIPLIQPGTGEDTTFYQVIHIMIGIIVGLIVFVSTFFYEEKHYLQEEEKVPFFESIKNTFKNKSFIIFEVISFTVIYVQAGLMLGLAFYLDELETSMLLLFIAMFIGIFIGLFLFIGKQGKLGVKKSMQIMIGIFSLSCFIILIFGRNLILTSIGFVGIGMAIVGGFFLIPLMNGDVIDKDEDMTGQRREGMYAGVNSFVTKYAISLAEAVFLFIIAIFGYDESLAKGQQSTLAETGIIIGWMLVPALLLLICFIVMHWYPLAGPEWNKTKTKLEKIHKDKEKAYLEKLGFKYVD
ncbi:MAG: MFS transporter [Candidatus Thorarchaeota archaeon]